MGLGLGLGFGAGSVVSFDPASIANLVVRFRCDLGATFATGRISALADQSGLGDSNRNASQAVAGNRPIYNATDAAFNNEPTIEDDDGFRYLATGTWSSTYAQATTVIVVGTITNRLVDGHTAGNRQGILVQGGHWSMYAGTSVIESAVAVGKGIAAAIFDGASSKLYVNSSAAPAVTGNPGTHALDVMGLLNTADGASGSTGDKVAEILAYSRALTQPELAQIFAYANARYAGGGWA